LQDTDSLIDEQNNRHCDKSIYLQKTDFSIRVLRTYSEIHGERTVGFFFFEILSENKNCLQGKELSRTTKRPSSEKKKIFTNSISESLIFEDT